MHPDVRLFTSECRCTVGSCNSCTTELMCDNSSLLVEGEVSVNSYGLKLFDGPLSGGVGDSVESLFSSNSQSSIGCGRD